MGSSLSEMARKAINRKKQKQGRPEHQSLETALDAAIGGNGTAVPQDEGGSAVAVQTNAAAEADDERQEALAPYMDGLPFDLERIRQRILDCGANILEEMFTIGKYLIWVKEEVGHGGFIGWLDAELGMSQQRAWEFMRITQRIIDSKSPYVRGFLREAAGDSKRKLLALMDVSDEEIQEVMETKSFLGRDLDEVEAMSYRELKDALRKEKNRNVELRDAQERETRKRLEAESELQRIKQPEEPDSETALTILDRQFVKAINVVGVMERIATEFAEEYGDEGLIDPEVRDMVNAYCATLSQKATNLRLILTPDEIAEERFHIKDGMPLEVVSGDGREAEEDDASQGGSRKDGRKGKGGKDRKDA